MIFISYSWKDWEIVEPILNKIRQLYDKQIYFIDKEDIKKGDNIYEKISFFIKKSSWFIPIITENYLNSKPCMAEFNGFYIKSLEEQGIIVPFYPKEIWEKTDYLLKAINSVVENVEELFNTLDKIKNGRSINLKNFVEDHFKLKQINNNAIVLELLNFTEEILSPKVEIVPINLEKFNEKIKEGDGWNQKSILIYTADNHQRMTHDNRLEQLFMGSWSKGISKTIIIVFDMKNNSHSSKEISLLLLEIKEINILNSNGHVLFTWKYSDFVLKNKIK